MSAHSKKPSTVASLALLESKRQIDQDWKAIYDEPYGILASLKTVFRGRIALKAMQEIVDVLVKFCAPFQRVCPHFVQITVAMQPNDIIAAMYINVKARMENGMILNNKNKSVRKLRTALSHAVDNVRGIQAASKSKQQKQNTTAPDHNTHSELVSPALDRRNPAQATLVSNPVAHAAQVPKQRSTFNSAEARASASAMQSLHRPSLAMPPASVAHQVIAHTQHAVMPWAGPDVMAYDDDDAELPYLHTEWQTKHRARARYYEEARNGTLFDTARLCETAPSALVDGFFAYNPVAMTPALHDAWMQQELVQMNHQETLAVNHAERQENVWGSHVYDNWHDMNRSLDFSAGTYPNTGARPPR